MGAILDERHSLGMDIEKSSDIYSFLRGTREQAGLSLAELSERMDVRESFLEMLENGELGRKLGPGYLRSLVVRYGASLGLDADDLLDEVERQLRADAAPAPAPLVKPADRPASVSDASPGDAFSSDAPASADLPPSDAEPAAEVPEFDATPEAAADSAAPATPPDLAASGPEPGEQVEPFGASDEPATDGPAPGEAVASEVAPADAPPPREAGARDAARAPDGEHGPDAVGPAETAVPAPAPEVEASPTSQPTPVSPDPEPESVQPPGMASSTDDAIAWPAPLAARASGTDPFESAPDDVSFGWRRSERHVYRAEHGGVMARLLRGVVAVLGLAAVAAVVVAAGIWVGTTYLAGDAGSATPVDAGPTVSAAPALEPAAGEESTAVQPQPTPTEELSSAGAPSDGSSGTAAGAAGAAAGYSVSLEARDEVWFEVIDAQTDEVYFSGIKNAGESLRLEVDGDVLVNTGRPESLAVRVNGSSIGAPSAFRWRITSEGITARD